jgi:hypothetical protein
LVVVVAAAEKQGKAGTSKTGEGQRRCAALPGGSPSTTSCDLGRCGPPPHGESGPHGREARIYGVQAFVIGKEDEGRSTATGAGKIVSFAEKGILFLPVGY